MESIPIASVTARDVVPWDVVGGPELAGWVRCCSGNPVIIEGSVEVLGDDLFTARESVPATHLCHYGTGLFQAVLRPHDASEKGLIIQDGGGHFVAAEPATRVCSFFFGRRNLACPQSRQTVNFGNAQTMGLLRPSNPER